MRGHEEGRGIGRGMANVRLYVMDGKGEIVPEGVRGELYIGGKGVGRGYLNRKEMTEERYEEAGMRKREGIPDGRSSEMEGRGVGVYRENGQPGKSEGLPDRAGGSRSGVEEDGGSKGSGGDGEGGEGGREKQMVAYLEGEGELKANEIRGYLKKEIPEYMIPTGYIR